MSAARKRKWVMFFQKYLLNPVVRPLAGIAPGWALLETTGRKSGQKRRVPVGGTRVGRSFWIVSEHGRRANYVRNLQADPRVRLKLRGRWYDATAHVVAEDDADRRRRGQSAWNRFAVGAFGTDLLSIRVDFDES